ncbi:hypothetical protein [Pseudophaeobacter arcticus]|jgi:hypothetical protein|uniref:hypothetical protein n=1 Tax=Pseudophaeobacter arcticus TaxID=385492 RepID=UPI000406B2D1|nr:hypothetical protein [Pseudophaeobacter arcticus]
MAKAEKTKKVRKDAQLIIRISKEERDAFVDLCDGLDTSAAREIRRFIRGFLREHDTTTSET